MKVSIIGGGGRVGSNAAFSLQCAGLVSEIHLLDELGCFASAANPRGRLTSGRPKVATSSRSPFKR